MQQFQVSPIPSVQKSFLVQLARDFRSALSYLSFYSSDSPFVVGAIRKLHKDLLRLLNTVHPLVLYREKGSLFVNGSPLNDTGDLYKILEEKNWEAVLIGEGLPYNEWISWLRHMAFPFEENQEASVPWEHLSQISLTDFILEESAAISPLPEVPEVVAVTGVEMEPLSPEAEMAIKTEPTTEDQIYVEEVFSPEALRPKLSSEQMEEAITPIPSTSGFISNEVSEMISSALLSSVAEAWQFSRLLKKTPKNDSKMIDLDNAHSQLFNHLLDRLEATSSDLKGITQWFRTSQGDVVENEAVLAMIPLVETAIRHHWTQVLFDPATEGLVNDCLSLWGANGKQDLVEEAVEALAEGLGRGESDRRIALTHLMDARPWVDNPALLGKVLDKLSHLLGEEKHPGLYQSALLSAWDLVELALRTNSEISALNLFSTLHFHADDDEPSTEFPERASIARHWLFERSTPELIRQLALCAHNAGRLDHFPLLGEMAAPLLLEDYFAANFEEKERIDQLFLEMRDSLRSALTERVADLKEPEELRLLLPILKISGIDAALSFQLSSWFSRGDRELKLNLIGLIDQIGEPDSGPALRLALFDDSEEIAAEAAKTLGKIGFIQAIPILIKAAKLRQSRGPDHEKFLIAVCGALGKLKQKEAIPFLEEIAKKKPLFKGANSPLTVRLAAVEAMTKVDQPEVWTFFETLATEKNPEMQEALDRMIREKTSLSI
jgi:HEAT repeat protein